MSVLEAIYRDDLASLAEQAGKFQRWLARAAANPAPPLAKDRKMLAEEVAGFGRRVKQFVEITDGD